MAAPAENGSKWNSSEDGAVIAVDLPPHRTAAATGKENLLRPRNSKVPSCRPIQKADLCRTILQLGPGSGEERKSIQSYIYSSMKKERDRVPINRGAAGHGFAYHHLHAVVHMGFFFLEMMGIHAFALMGPVRLQATLSPPLYKP